MISPVPKLICRTSSALVLGWLSASATVLAATDDFPLRASFPDVKVISTAGLHAQLDQVVVVDVRSQLEFDVIHIAGAVHAPVAMVTFGAELGAIRGEFPDKPIVFYCNGHTCPKSYKAARVGHQLGFGRLFAYDAGIFDWSRAYPEHAALLGKTPVEERRLLSEQAFQSRLLDVDEFKERAAGGNYLVVDVREPMLREGEPVIDGSLNIYGARLLQLMQQGRMPRRPLLIYDAVGRVVRWLQYYLEEHDYTDFHFLRDGAAALKD